MASASQIAIYFICLRKGGGRDGDGGIHYILYYIWYIRIKIRTGQRRHFWGVVRDRDLLSAEPDNNSNYDYDNVRQL